MLKDLLESLQQGTEQIELRRDLNEQALASLLAPQLNSADPNGHRGNNRNDGKHGHHGNNLGAPVGNHGNRLDAFLQAISTQESGGNYQAQGVPTQYGTAYGKYQILDSNFTGPGGWDKDALGRDISLQQYLNHPKLQEKIAQGKLSDYFKQYGARGAAKAWYAGEGNARTNSDSPQYGGPSINDYAASVLKHMTGYL